MLCNAFDLNGSRGELYITRILLVNENTQF